VIHPVGFLSDHMEVLFHLDEEARLLSEELGFNMVRSGTLGVHPRFVAILRELIEDRIGASPRSDRRAIGRFGPNHDVCPEDCCPPPARPASRG
jgi:ferrochelatase